MTETRPTIRPTIRLKPGTQRRVRDGHPWIYSNEVVMDASAKALAPGTLVRVEAADGRAIGAAMFNPHPLIAARLLSRDAGARIDADFLAARVARALAVRDALYAAPFYRLVHAEADGLPGLVADRFGDCLVLQVNTAGMERLEEPLLEALERVLAPRVIVLRNDTPARALEHLDQGVRIARGRDPGVVEVRENGCAFFANPAEGQKTGWFYDQRDNRAFVAGLARGRSMLDMYCHTGGFAVTAARAGAARVEGWDRSRTALDLAQRAAGANDVGGAAGANDDGACCTFQRGEAFQTMERLRASAARYGVVVVDPPAFVKTKKDLHAGLRGYRKLARLAAGLVEPGGYLCIASCSHHVDAPAFTAEVRRGLAGAGREARILRTAGAAPDHPVHPALPESAYLKMLVLALD